VTVDPDLAPILAELARLDDSGLFSEGRLQARGASASWPVMSEGSPLAAIPPKMFGRIVDALEAVRAGTVVGAPISPDQARHLTDLMMGGPEQFAKAMSRFRSLSGGVLAGLDDASRDELTVEPTTIRVLAEFARRESGYEHGPLADWEVARVIEHIEGLAFRADASAPKPEESRLINELLRIGRAGSTRPGQVVS